MGKGIPCHSDLASCSNSSSNSAIGPSPLLGVAAAPFAGLLSSAAFPLKGTMSSSKLRDTETGGKVSLAPTFRLPYSKEL